MVRWYHQRAIACERGDRYRASPVGSATHTPSRVANGGRGRRERAENVKKSEIRLQK